jgi:hypothetical protein
VAVWVGVAVGVRVAHEQPSRQRSSSHRISSAAAQTGGVTEAQVRVGVTVGVGSTQREFSPLHSCGKAKGVSSARQEKPAPGPVPRQWFIPSQHDGGRTVLVGVRVDVDAGGAGVTVRVAEGASVADSGGLGETVGCNGAASSPPHPARTSSRVAATHQPTCLIAEAPPDPPGR